MQFEYDPERLIKEVKKRRGVWDYESADYSSKAAKCKLWHEIVNELISPGITVSKSERRELEIQLQKKWKSIRDCFQKYINNPNRTKKPYVYFKQLLFLLKDQYNEEQQKENQSSSDSDDSPKPSVVLRKIWRKRQKMSLNKEEDQTTEEDNGNNNSMAISQDDSRDFSNDATDNEKLTKVATLSKGPEEFLFANVDVQRNEPEDPDKLFLLSLLPHLKTVPEELRLNVKVEIMQVLRNANYSAGREPKVF